MLNKKLISDETKEKLKYLSEFNMDYITQEVDRMRKILHTLERSEVELSKLQPNSPLSINVEQGKKLLFTSFENLKALANYRLFIGILYLDLTTSVRFYLNAKYHYEGVFATRQIIVIINEGYKQIYNFSKTKVGTEKTGLRNNSFWVKGIGKIIKSDLHHLKSKYDELTNILTKYEDVVNKTYKERSLSVHYHKDPLKVYEVYDMMVELDIDSIFQKLIPFLSILNKMFDFTNDVNNSYYLESNAIKEKTNKSYVDMIENLENLKANAQNDSSTATNYLGMITDLQDRIKTFLA